MVSKNRFSSSVTGALPVFGTASPPSSMRSTSSGYAGSSRTKSVGGSDCSARSSTEKYAARAEKALKHEEHHSSALRTTSISSRQSDGGSGLSIGGDANTDILWSQVPFVGRETELASIGEAIDYLVSSAQQDDAKPNAVEEQKESPVHVQPRVVSIVGSAGSGKSRLAGELKSLVLDRDGYFVRGKCESFSRSEANSNTNATTNDNSSSTTAYAALANAMKGLADQIIARDFDMGIRRRLQEAVGPQDALVLTEIFPALATLLERDEEEEEYNNNASLRMKEPDSSKQQPSQDQRARRRRFLFSQFMRVLLTSSIDYCDEDIGAGDEQKPQNQEAFALVLVLDDVQWIDKASLDLVSALVGDQDLKNFLLVTTLRPEGEDLNRPFGRESRQWQDNNVPIKAYRLDCLDSFSINTIVATILDTERELTSDLAVIVHQKTNGNAFFALEFIKALVEQNLLRYSYKSMSWKWDTTKVQSLVINGNSAVGLLVAKLNRLPVNQQLVLLVTACMGGTFEPGLLKSILHKLKGIQIHPEAPKEEQKDNSDNDDVGVEDRLDSLVRMGLLGHHANLYYITHDLVKEAVLEFVPPEKIALLKVRIGDHILNQLGDNPTSQQQDLLFVGVGLCNTAVAPAGAAVEFSLTTSKLAEYNLLAGEKAMRESTFGCALQFMESGLHWLEQASGNSDADADTIHKSHYDRLLAGAAEASFCAGNAENVDAYADKLLSTNNCSMENRLRMIQLKVSSATAQERYEEVIDCGWTAIKLLKMNTFSKKPGTLHVLKQLLKTKSQIQKHTKESLLALPITTDENRTHAQKFFDLMQQAAFLVNPTFFLVSQLKSVRWALKYGVSKYTPLALTLFGTISQHIFNDYPRGVMYGDVALELADQLAGKETIARTSMNMFGLLHFWTTDMRDCHAPISYASRLAMECGDTLTSFTSYFFMDTISWCSARVPLPVLAKDLERHAAACREYKNTNCLDGLVAMALHLRKLCGDDDKSLLWLEHMADSSYFHREREGRKGLPVEESRGSLALEEHLLLGNKAEALQLTWKLKDICKNSMGLANVHRMQYYRGLVLLGAIADGREMKKCRTELKAVVTMLKKWVDSGNVNCHHMVWLLEAEQARIKKQTEEAKKLYGDAIRRAGLTQRTHDVGLGNQYAANFYLEIDDRSRATYHMQQAINAYRDWGASTLVRKLQEEHSEMLKETSWGGGQHQCVFSMPN